MRAQPLFSVPIQRISIVLIAGMTLMTSMGCALISAEDGGESPVSKNLSAENGSPADQSGASTVMNTSTLVGGGIGVGVGAVIGSAVGDPAIGTVLGGAAGAGAGYAVGQELELSAARTSQMQEAMKRQSAELDRQEREIAELRAAQMRMR